MKPENKRWIKRVMLGISVFGYPTMVGLFDWKEFHSAQTKDDLPFQLTGQIVAYSLVALAIAVDQLLNSNDETAFTARIRSAWTRMLIGGFPFSTLILAFTWRWNFVGHRVLADHLLITLFAWCLGGLLIGLLGSLLGKALNKELKIEKTVV